MLRSQNTEEENKQDTKSYLSVFQSFWTGVSSTPSDQRSPGVRWVVLDGEAGNKAFLISIVLLQYRNLFYMPNFHLLRPMFVRKGWKSHELWHARTPVMGSPNVLGNHINIFTLQRIIKYLKMFYLYGPGKLK